MSANTNPNVVTDGLVLYLDAGNDESYANSGVIPPKSESITSGSFVDSAPNDNNYTVIGDDGVRLHSNDTDYMGYFPQTLPSTGYWTIAFDYVSDVGANFLVDNNGVNNDIFLTTIAATTEKQTWSLTKNLTSTGSADVYLRRVNGGDITITNWRYFKTDSSGNSLVAHDLSTTELDGTLINGAVYDSDEKGNFSFDGVDDHIVLPYDSNLNNQNFSVCQWLYSTDFAQQATLWQRGTTGAHNQSIDTQLFTNPGTYDKLLVFRIITDDSNSGNNGWMDFYIYSGGNYSVHNNLLIDSKWNYLVCTYNSAADLAEIYHNGVLLAQRTHGGTIYMPSTSAGIAYISRMGNYAFDGKIASTQVYSKALSGTEILQNYNAHKARYGL